MAYIAVGTDSDMTSNKILLILKEKRSMRLSPSSLNVPAAFHLTLDHMTSCIRISRMHGYTAPTSSTLVKESCKKKALGEKLIERELENTFVSDFPAFHIASCLSHH